MINDKGHLGSPSEAVKLAQWSNAPCVSDLKQDLIDSQSDHDAQLVKMSTWKDNLNITGSARMKKTKGRSSVQPKLIKKHAEWRYAALSEPFLSNENIFRIEPKTYEDGPRAKQNQLILNNQFNTQMDKVNLIDSYVRADVDEGTAILRVGWDFKEEEQEVEIDRYDFLPAQSQQEMQEVQQYLQLAQQDSITFKNTAEDHWQQAVQMSMQSGQPIFPVYIETNIEKVMVTVKNRPTVEVCDYRNITIDPSCKGDTSKAGFAIFSFETSKSELKKAGNYTNLDKIIPSGSDVISNPYHTANDDMSFTFKDEPRKKIVAFEYWGSWDIDGSGVTQSIVATWVGDVMIRLELNPFPDKAIPFVFVQYLPVRDNSYGEPDGELLKDNQAIVGAVTRGAIDLLAKSANSQQGMRKDALDPINKRKYAAGLDYEFNPNVDPTSLAYMHKFPEIPNSVGIMLQEQKGEANEMSGIRAFGPTNSSAGTATADRGVLDAASKRETGILRRLTAGLEQVARKIIAMNAEWLSAEEVVRVTNEEFITVKREDLAGKFDLKLSISTAEADEAKAKELAFMLQTMGNSVDFGISKIALIKIAELRKMPELAKKIEQFEPQPDPMEQQLKQLEMQKLQAEIEEVKARTQEYLTQAQKNMADAGNKQSDTDAKDQEFIHKEDGTTHQRDLEKQGAQAQANMGLEVVKASLNKQESAPTK